MGWSPLVNANLQNAEVKLWIESIMVKKESQRKAKSKGGISMKKGSFSLLLVLLLSVIVSPFALATSNLEGGIGQLAQQIIKSAKERQKQ